VITGRKDNAPAWAVVRVAARGAVRDAGQALSWAVAPAVAWAMALVVAWAVAQVARGLAPDSLNVDVVS
jgi:hypothetical protein